MSVRLAAVGNQYQPAPWCMKDPPPLVLGRLATLTNSPPLIELDDVAFHVDGHPVVAGLHWRLEAGERWAVLGPNGSGKTTLLRIATGYLWPTSGVVRRLGRQRIDLGVLRRSIGWISAGLLAQIPNDEPARDTVVSGRFAQIGLKNLEWLRPTADDRAQADYRLEQLGCQDLANRPFGVLSQGEKQKVLIARARMAEPVLLILDEPCAGMDPGGRERMLAAVQAVAEDDPRLAIVLVTHHVEEIMPAFSHTMVMSGGRIVTMGATTDVVTPEKLSEIYRVSVAEMVESAGRHWPIWNLRL